MEVLASQEHPKVPIPISNVFLILSHRAYLGGTNLELKQSIHVVQCHIINPDRLHKMVEINHPAHVRLISQESEIFCSQRQGTIWFSFFFPFRKRE